MRVNFAFLCLSAQPGMLGLLEAKGIALERIGVDGRSKRIPGLDLVVHFEHSAAEAGKRYLAQVVVLDADGQLVTDPRELCGVVPRLDKLRGYSLEVIHLGDIQFTKFGDHAISLLIEGRESISIPFEVTRARGT